MHKTIKKWLKEFPEPYRTEALDIVGNEQWLNKTKAESAKEALLQAFVWVYSPQGYPYWAELYNKLNADQNKF